MNDFTSSVSRLGRKANGTDDRELNLIEFGQMTLEAFDQTQDFKNFVFEHMIKGAKAHAFPVIGRKRDASDHIPGDQIKGGTVNHEEVAITVDNMLIDSVFVADIDEILLHYSVRSAYSKQLGQSLGNVKSKRVAQTIVNASRLPALLPGEHATPVRFGSATMKTSAAKMEEAHFRAMQFIKENDIGGGDMASWWPWAQYYLMARYIGIDDTDTSGSGNRSEATVGRVGGFMPKGSNYIPSTNITTGIAKYQGDFTATAGFAANALAAGMLTAKQFTLDVVNAKDRLGTLFIASELYGVGALRRETSIEFTTLITGTNVVSID
jgi:hypothetical protein